MNQFRVFPKNKWSPERIQPEVASPLVSTTTKAPPSIATYLSPAFKYLPESVNFVASTRSPPNTITSSLSVERITLASSNVPLIAIGKLPSTVFSTGTNSKFLITISVISSHPPELSMKPYPRSHEMNQFRVFPEEQVVSRKNQPEVASPLVSTTTKAPPSIATYLSPAFKYLPECEFRSINKITSNTITSSLSVERINLLHLMYH